MDIVRAAWELLDYMINEHRTNMPCCYCLTFKILHLKQEKILSVIYTLALFLIWKTVGSFKAISLNLDHDNIKNCILRIIIPHGEF